MENLLNQILGFSIYANTVGAGTGDNPFIPKGFWNALTNAPVLVSSVGTQEDYYTVSVSGTTLLNGINDWEVNDIIFFDGGSWRKIDNTDKVLSVAGKTGVVTLISNDITNFVNLITALNPGDGANYFAVKDSSSPTPLPFFEVVEEESTIRFKRSYWEHGNPTSDILQASFYNTFGTPFQILHDGFNNSGYILLIPTTTNPNGERQLAYNTTTKTIVYRDNVGVKTIATTTQLTDHTSNTSNPHSVTKTQVGLSAVTNDAQLKIASNLSDVNNANTSFNNISPVTTKGDLIVRNATVNTRQGIGADEKILQADSTQANGLIWNQPGFGNYLFTSQIALNTAAANVISATITGTVTDFTHANINTASIIRFTLSGNTILNSIIAPSPLTNRILIISNIDNANKLTIPHNTGATAGNRFSLPKGVGLDIEFNTGAMFIYDTIDSRWRILSAKIA